MAAPIEAVRYLLSLDTQSCLDDLASCRFSMLCAVTGVTVMPSSYRPRRFAAEEHKRSFCLNYTQFAVLRVLHKVDLSAFQSRRVTAALISIWHRHNDDLVVDEDMLLIQNAGHSQRRTTDCGYGSKLNTRRS